MSKVRMVLASLLTIAMLLVLIQIYCLFKQDFFDFRADLFYYSIIIILIIVSVFINKYKSKLIACFLSLLVLFMLVKPLNNYLSEYQLKKSFETGNKMVTKIDIFNKQKNRFPHDLNEIYKDRQPKYYNFLLPLNFQYLNRGTEYSLIIKHTMGRQYCYYSSLNKWLLTD
jgi:energy-coupling factor transporter transmembrane protein EcfT